MQKLDGLDDLKLNEIYLSHNLIGKIDGLPKTLRVLDLTCNGLKSLEGLNELEDLEEIWVR